VGRVDLVGLGSGNCDMRVWDFDCVIIIGLVNLAWISDLRQ